MAISDDERFKLLHGPYETPRFKYGKKGFDSQSLADSAQERL